MKRTTAAIWIAGATVPLLVATVFVFGCCILPFHGLVHKVMPLCHTAAAMMAGGSHSDHPSVPAQPKEEPVKQWTTEVPAAYQLAATTATPQRFAATLATGYRSFITLGAVRCDRDVGLHVLVQTFLI